MASAGSSIFKPRWSTAVVLLILTTAFLVASVASRWTHDVLFDTDAWLDTVGPIGTEEVITDALSERVSDSLIEGLDMENRMETALPPVLAPLAGLVAPWVNDAIVEETNGFFESDFYEDAWLAINARGHAAVVAIIRDQLPLVSTEGGVVTVDLEPILSPVTDRVFDRLTELGEVIPDAILDRVDIDETVSEIMQTYEEEGLPERLRTVQVYDSERLAAVQQATALFDRLVWVLPVITIVLAAAAIYFAPLRGLMVVLLLGSAAVGWILAWFAVQLVGNAIVSSIDATTTAAVADEVFTAATDGLTTLLVWLAVVAGLASVVVGWWLYRGEEEEEAANPPVT